MMAVAQIKQGIEYAEGFRVLNQEAGDVIELPTGDQIDFDELETELWMRKIVYPRLLTCIIEGINKSETCDLVITQNYDSIEIEGSIQKYFDILDNPNQAKEAAIIWVVEHES